MIVVLDAYTLCGEHRDVLEHILHPYGQVKIYDRTLPAQVVERAKGAEYVFTNKVVMDAAVMAALPDLRFIGVLATGYNVVDIEAARARGIVVANVPAYSTESVAQMVFAHLLNITQRVGHYADEVRSGAWSGQPDFSYRNTRLMELWGKTIGLVGFGNTGQATARIALGFGMKVRVFTSKAQQQLPQGVAKATLEEVFSGSDVVSLHCPLTRENSRMVNRDLLATMKPGAILINTARGGLVDDEALADALRSGHLMAAGLDVLTDEPPAPGHPLVGLENCFITPHIAWATEEAIARLVAITARNLQTAAEGHPANNVAAR
ncbi:MAG: D-2-hydroxyacid dehydrogenase [Phocaeicola plebeius]